MMVNQSPSHAPKIQFTNLYRLTDICDIDRDGKFSRDWDKSYTTLDSGKSKVNVPSDGGSQILLRQLRLKPFEDLPEDVRNILGHQEALYLVTSTRYAMHYVGMTAGGIAGVFKGSGRFSHHARKMLASVVNKGTNHTGGWIDHAKDRYENLLSDVEHGEEPTDEELLGDVFITFGVSDTDWVSEDHEGIAEDYFKERLAAVKGKLSVSMNRKTTYRKPAEISEPKNFDEVLSQ